MLEDAVSEALSWARSVLGQVECISDSSKEHGDRQSGALRIRNHDRPLILKIHADQFFWRNEVHAYERWTAALGPLAPTLVAVRDVYPFALIMTELPGRPLEDVRLPPREEENVWREAGAALTLLHGIGPGEFFGPCERDGSPLEPTGRDVLAHLASRLQEKAERAARAGLLDRHESAVVEAALDLVPAFAGEHPTACHRDYSAANWIVACGRLSGVIDFEFSYWDVRTADFSRDPGWTWIHRPDLIAAFFEGYDHKLTEREKEKLFVSRTEYALDAVIWGREHQYYGFEREGHAALRHLGSEWGIRGCH